MIIKGGPSGNIGFWTKHLLRDDTNELAEVKEISGLLAKDLKGVLREMKAIADQSRCQGNFLYQANINPRDDEYLTAAQWKEAVDTLEKNLGLEGHQRIVVEHIKHGRQHCHIVWNRVDVDTLRVTDIGGNYYIHEKTARDLENRFGLTPTPPRSPDQPRAAQLDLWEIRAAEKSGIDPAALKAEITELWKSAPNGQAFAAALEDRGYILAQGDRRVFCIVDQAGDAHSLARRLDGVNSKGVREGMADVDRDALPTVAEARETQRAREISHAHEPPPPAPIAARATEAPAVAKTESAPEPVLERAGAQAETKANIYPFDPAPKTGASKHSDVDLERAARTLERAPLRVVDMASGATDTLTDFVSGLFAAKATQPQDPANMDRKAQIIAQRKAAHALDNIRDRMAAGEDLHASDIRNLTPSHLENIRLRGDDLMRQMIADMERYQKREQEYGRTRER